MPARQDMGVWTGRVDTIDGEAGRRWHQVVRPAYERDPTLVRGGVALLGFACDAGVARGHGRPGAAAGPPELRRALANLAWHGGGTGLTDAGDIVCEADALETAQQEYAGALARLLVTGQFPIGFGGGHEIAWAAYQGLASALRDDARLERLGIVNFDAHLDLRQPEAPGRGTSGTPFLQIADARAAARLPFRYLCIGASETSNTPALLDRAATLGAEIIFDHETAWPAHQSVSARLARFIADCSAIYLTFCLDALPASVAPGVSAPAGLGIAPDRAIALLREVLAGCGAGIAGSKLLLSDVAEFNPRFDVDGRTARIAARIVYEIGTFPTD